MEKTRLTSTPVLTNFAAWFQHILAENHFVIACMNAALEYLTNENEVYPVFNQIRERHHKIATFLSEYMKQIKKVKLMPGLVD